MRRWTAIFLSLAMTWTQTAFAQSSTPQSDDLQADATPAQTSPVRMTQPPALIVGPIPPSKQAAPLPADAESSQDGETVQELKSVRLAGGATAGAGFGMLGYAVAAEAFGPIGWALALIFVGGTTAYMAHRGLQGEKDFQSHLIPPPSIQQSAPQPAPQAAPPQPPANPRPPQPEQPPVSKPSM